MGDPEFGRVRPCPSCGGDGSERRRAFCEIPKGMQKWTFEALEVSPEMQECVDAAMAMAKGEADFRWLVLQGSLGTGKTHVGVAVLNARVEHPDWGPLGKYINCPDFLDVLRSGFHDDSYEQLFNQYRDVGLLFLDDLGAERKRRVDGAISFAEEKVYQLLDHRLRHELETIVGTNTPVKDMEPRVADRLLSQRTGFSRVFSAVWPSYRSGRTW